jgi:2-polyprenyl-3-methyl-5-hydroxy-6-metoxy-1,4-benzoquinol methylase
MTLSEPPTLPAAKVAHWERVYGQRREDEVSWFQARPGTSLDLIARTGAGLDARIVDVGGGASRLVDALVEAGYRDVVVLDLASAALERAKARLGASAARASWVQRDVAGWAPDAPFDVWHDRAVFHFMVTPEERQAYRATLMRALKPGGQAIIATFASDGPERCSGLPVRRYEPEQLAAELGDGFQLVERLREEHLTPGGKMQRFQFSRLQRR